MLQATAARSHRRFEGSGQLAAGFVTLLGPESMVIMVWCSSGWWFVVWNIFYFLYIGKNHPNFFGGVETANQSWLILFILIFLKHMGFPGHPWPQTHDMGAFPPGL